ncbi:NUDIX hydrolase [Sphingomonas sp. KR1UV-12]|uniref:GDP-mannose pyrophosphatase n=1 Tax=Sphingomonas aurea TaxID=3063994 RepID=A0ABT9ELP4_9SPHN|nr:NUDIX hydrolase [Sphingomonas sp. KR1UV-12]MDP1027885.1 NUDIX hydrolase [Sphingomonas sp. KR1UV-12]
MMTETMWEGRFLAVRKNGTWEYAERQGQIGAAVIVAIDDADRLVLVEQHRIPIGRRTLELPAGLVGDEDAGESLADAAARELEEETGYRPANVEELGLFYSSPGMTSESFTIVRATGLTKVGEGGGSAEEDITVHLVPIAEVPAYVRRARETGLGIDAKMLLVLDYATM